MRSAQERALRTEHAGHTVKQNGATIILRQA
jgi:hypothetical protein